MKSARQLTVLITFLLPFIWGENESAVFGQRGKNGALVVTSTTVTVNEYDRLTAPAAAGATSIKVNASTINTNGRFPGVLASGDLIMIIQVQGADIRGIPPTPFDPFSEPRDSTWGGITNYNNCGNWEFAEVNSVPDAITINLDCPLIHDYTNTGKTVVVRVPRYTSLTVNSSGTITCDLWNGIIGGICAIEVENNMTLNGSINTNGKGFRGGAVHNPSSALGVGEAASLDATYGGEKGEGIAGYQGTYDQFGGRYCKGAGANGGGGGDAHNCGGGGGANAGDTLLWNGHGNPDNSVAGWTNAWNLQYSGFAFQTSSGGGQGGYSFSNNSSPKDPTVVGPNNTQWGGDNRRSHGGIGGRPLDYSTGRLFLGGGGGSGEGNDNSAGAGGIGGGLIYVMNYGLVSGTGQLISNGNNGSNTTNNYKDGAGGGGGGGTIVLNSVGAIVGISMTANGGKGGDQSFVVPLIQAEGPGGGGSGGYIAISNGIPTRTTSGGTNGITNSSGVSSKFPPNGATKGGAGINNGIVTNFVVNAANTTLCAGQAATLTASLGGNPPAGTTIIWYDALVGGNVLPSTGGAYTTPVLAVGTYTYYVGACPGTYHQPVTVKATASPVVSAGNDATICIGSGTTLNAGGGTSYSWSPATGLSNTTIANPVATPIATTTYVLSGITSCGPATDTVIVSVGTPNFANVSPNSTICTGSSVTLSASGGTSYAWTTGATTSVISITPSTSTTYTVIVNNGICKDTATTLVTLANGLNATINGSTTICKGGNTTLTASGGTTYSWSTGQTNVAITVAPTTNTTYTVTASDGICTGTASILVTVSNGLNASISGSTAICIGGSTTLTASGGTNYSWTTGQTSASIVVTPTTTTTYSVSVSSAPCVASASIAVNVGSSITASVTGNTTVCQGGSTTLTASGGSTYVWSNGTSAATISITPTGASTYSVIATSGSCSDTAAASLSVTPSPTITLTAASNTICAGGATTINAFGGNNYSWNTGSSASSISISPASTTTYVVTSDNSGCSGTASMQITVLPLPNAVISGNPNVCQGYAATLTAQGGGTYLWSSGETTASINPTTSGTYSVFVSVGPCKDTAFVVSAVIPNPTAGVSPEVTIFPGQSTDLSATGGTTYAWDNGNTGAAITVSPLSTTVYCVTAYDVNNCFDTACTRVNVESCQPPYLPNAFSPNGDEENDDMQLYFGALQCITNFHLTIYNRWGEKVYVTSDPAFKWNGVYNTGLMKNLAYKEPGNTEVYAYYMDVEMIDGRKISKKGNISLVR